jgi:DNA-binding CsgD family transcriptional regulator
MHPLTPAQYDVARLYATGLPRIEIARRLGISPRAVSDRMYIVRRHLGIGVRERRELAAVLPRCRVMPLFRRNALGFFAGDTLAITGGLYAGRTGTYVSRSNTRQVLVRVGCGVVSLRAAYLQKLDDPC